MDEEIEKQQREIMLQIGKTRMPFGKFGPTHYPPAGVPIYDLPVEYLHWFTENGGFPRGKLGQLMEMVYHAKVNGADRAFDILRTRNGGRTKLFPKKRAKNITIDP